MDELRRMGSGKIMIKVIETLRCSWCGRFVSESTSSIYQPKTDSWKLEQEDPELICNDCVKRESVK